MRQITKCLKGFHCPFYPDPPSAQLVCYMNNSECIINSGDGGPPPPEPTPNGGAGAPDIQDSGFRGLCPLPNVGDRAANFLSFHDKVDHFHNSKFDFF